MAVFFIDKTPKTKRPLSKINKTKIFERSAERQNCGLCFALFAFSDIYSMDFFNSAVGVLQTLVVALGAGLGIWGVINLLEGYGNDNPGAKSQGMKQLMAGGGVALIGITLVPLLTGLFG